MKEIQLTQGKVAIVDDEDFEWLNQWKWVIRGIGYAAGRIPVENGNDNVTYMHRAVMRIVAGDVRYIDHINGNKLDNRKQNLRIVTPSQNMHNQKLSKANTSGYKGVYWDKRRNKWSSQISVNERHKYIGLFDNPKDAYKAYCDAALKYHGDFANFGNGCVALKENDVSR